MTDRRKHVNFNERLTHVEPTYSSQYYDRKNKYISYPAPRGSDNDFQTQEYTGINKYKAKHNMIGGKFRKSRRNRTRRSKSRRNRTMRK